MNPKLNKQDSSRIGFSHTSILHCWKGLPSVKSGQPNFKASANYCKMAWITYSEKLEHHPLSSSQRWACPAANSTLSQRSGAGTALSSSAMGPKIFTAPTWALTLQGHAHVLCSRRNKNLTSSWCVNPSNPKCSVKYLTESLILLGSC